MKNKKYRKLISAVIAVKINGKSDYYGATFPMYFDRNFDYSNIGTSDWDQDIINSVRNQLKTFEGYKHWVKKLDSNELKEVFVDITPVVNYEIKQRSFKQKVLDLFR